jgi:hypothetical protein
MSPLPGRRALGWFLLFWLGVSFAVWNGFFDILVTRGEKQYFLSQARHELGLGPRTTVHEVMTRTIHDAVRIASIWALIVFASGVGSVLVARRPTRGEAPRQRPT